MITTEPTTELKLIDAIKKAFIGVESTELFSTENDYVSAIQSDRGTILIKPKEPFCFDMNIKDSLEDLFPSTEYQIRITKKIIRITKLSCL